MSIIESSPITDADKMRAMRAAGVSLRLVAKAFNCSTMTVLYKTDPEYAARHRAKCNASRTEKRRARGIGPRVFREPQPKPTVDVPESEILYDGGDVWIEDRTINLYGVGACEQREARRRFRKCGSASLASWRKPENRPSPEPTVAPTHYVPAPIIAWDRYYKHGDGNAIAEYLRSIGRQ